MTSTKFYPSSMIRNRILGRYRRYKEKKDHLKKIAEVRRNASLCNQGSMGQRECPAVLCLVKDGMEHLPSFMDHYRRLGFEDFVFLDNGSSDGTLEYLIGGNCTVYECSLGYEEYIYAMKQFLVHLCGEGRWSLYVDVDELWLYPGCKNTSLTQFVKYLDNSGYNACQAHMLDMFPENFQFASDSVGYNRSGVLGEDYPFFTLRGLKKSGFDRYFIQDDGRRFQYHGGVNQHLFGLEDIYLSKIPLIKLDDSMLVHVTSHISKHIVLADLSCVLLHYKFTDAFFAKARKIVEKKRDRWAVEYYGKILNKMKGNTIAISGQDSIKFSDVEQLVQLGFVDGSDTYNASNNTSRKPCP